MRLDNLGLNEILQKKRLVENSDEQERLLEVVKNKIDIYRPKEKDFSDMYGAEVVEADVQEIEGYKKTWEKEGDPELKRLKNVATIYEGVLLDQIEQSEWFGSDVVMYPASHYDDVKHGIDAIGEFRSEDEKKYLGLGIDVVFTSRPERIRKKLDSIKDMIRKGDLAQVKYFEDEDGNKKSLQVPRIIVGSRLSSAEKLITTWASKDKDKNKKLAEDSTQTKIVLEAYMQLYYFHHFAKQCGHDDVARAYGETFNLFSDIFAEKQRLINEQYNEVSDDVVFETIEKYTKVEE